MKITDCQPGSGNPSVRGMEGRGAYGKRELMAEIGNRCTHRKGKEPETLCLPVARAVFLPDAGPQAIPQPAYTYLSHRPGG